MRRQSKSERTSHRALGPKDVDDFRDLAKNLIEPGGYGYVFCFLLQFSTWWQRLLSLIEEKEISNDAESEEVKTR